jgi:hypothetical protein
MILSTSTQTNAIQSFQVSNSSRFCRSSQNPLPTGLVILKTHPPSIPTAFLKARAKSLFFLSTPSLVRKQQRLCLPPYRQALALLSDFLNDAKDDHKMGAWLRHKDLPYNLNRSILPNSGVCLDRLFFAETQKLGPDFRLICEEKSLKFLILEGPITSAFVKQGLSWVFESIPKPRASTTLQRRDHHSFTRAESALRSRREEQEPREFTPVNDEAASTGQRRDHHSFTRAESALRSRREEQEPREFTPVNDEAASTRQRRDHHSFTRAESALRSRREEQEPREFTPVNDEAASTRQRRDQSTFGPCELVKADALEGLTPQRLCILIDSPLRA